MLRRVALVSFLLAIAASASVLAQEAPPLPQDPGLRVLPQDPGLRAAQAPAPAPEPPQTLQPPTQPPQTLQPPTQPPRGDKPQPGRPPGATQPTPPVPDLTPRKARGRELNVQVELTITDQSGSAAPVKKVVSLLAADQTMGRVRANAHAARPTGGPPVGTGLNVDARPTVLEGDRILLELTLEYMPLLDNKVEPTNLNESIAVILQNAKPLVISQAADPTSDRRMTVEVKATILK